MDEDRDRFRACWAYRLGCPPPPPTWTDYPMLARGDGMGADFRRRAEGGRCARWRFAGPVGGGGGGGAFLSSTVLELFLGHFRTLAWLAGLFVGFALLGDGFWLSGRRPSRSPRVCSCCARAPVLPRGRFARSGGCLAWDKAAALAVARNWWLWSQAQGRSYWAGRPGAPCLRRASFVRVAQGRVQFPDMTILPGAAVAMTGPFGQRKKSP